MRRGEAPSIIIQLLRHHYFASSLRPHSDGLSRSLIFRPRRSEILFSDGAGKTGNCHGGGVANLSTTAMKKGGGILGLPRGQREQNGRTSFPLNFVPSLFVAPSLSHSLFVETHMCFQSDSDKVSFAASPLPPLLLLRFCRPADSISFDMSLRRTKRVSGFYQPRPSRSADGRTRVRRRGRARCGAPVIIAVLLTLSGRSLFPSHRGPRRA